MSCGLIADLIGELPLVLASSSPRRRRILRGLDLEFVIEPPGTDESVDAGETPEDHVVRLAGMKAAEVARLYAEGTVLGADTIVVIDGVMLGKPSDPPDAVRMLKAISGRWHEVLTGLAVIRCSDGATVRGFERTKVLVRELSESEIDGYVAGGEPLDKAGSYAIQECGAAVVSRVDGCFYNVVGLPVVRLSLLLKELRGEAC
jgi:septum formation protein